MFKFDDSESTQNCTANGKGTFYDVLIGVVVKMYIFLIPVVASDSGLLNYSYYGSRTTLLLMTFLVSIAYVISTV